MRLEVVADAEAAAVRAADQLAAAVRADVAARGRCSLALSGGTTPWRMLGHLAGFDLPWQHVQVFQVDERIVPAGDPARNATQIEALLVQRGALPAANFHPMPVEQADLAAAARDYAARLAGCCGPAGLDLVQLGLGTDGHTASLPPGDAVLDLHDDVGITAAYAGHRRMTLTLPLIGRARRILWLVTGAAKAVPLAELVAGRGATPAVRVAREQAVVIADAAAASAISPA